MSVCWYFIIYVCFVFEQTNITFEVNYYSPDGKVGNWGHEEFEYPLTDDNIDEPYEDMDGDSVFSGGTTRSGRNLPASLLSTQALRFNENGSVCYSQAINASDRTSTNVLY